MFLVVCCQCELCAQGSRRDVLSNPAGFQSFRSGLCRDSGKRLAVENFSKRVVILLKCCSPSFKKYAADPRH